MNKLENTPENKARFFAQYLLQNVFIETKDTAYPMTILGIDSEMGAHVFDRGIQLRSYYTVEHGTLLLTPLSQISDEDAIWVAKIENRYDDPVRRGKFIASIISQDYPFSLTMRNLLIIVDYLRSKGYALPWVGLSVDDLVSYGWVKLKGCQHES